MYAALSTFNLGPGMRSTGTKMADQFASAMKAMKGFKGQTYFANPEAGEYMVLVIWESKEDAEAAHAITGPKAKEAMANILKAPPTWKVFEVYEPKA
jgi:heme-degrading monooxygenase HmoA